MSSPDRDSGGDDGLDRADLSAGTRFQLYVEDVKSWYADHLRFVFRGGERPDMLPPHPRRVTRTYWLDRWG